MNSFNIDLSIIDALSLGNVEILFDFPTVQAWNGFPQGTTVFVFTNDDLNQTYAGLKRLSAILYKG